MKKTEILKVLREKGELSLSDMHNALVATNPKANKPIILHHLRGLLENGIIKRTANRAYKITEISKGILAESMGEVLIPMIIVHG